MFILTPLASVIDSLCILQSADPAFGTGGFFLAAYDWMTEHLELDKEQKEFLKYHTFASNEIVAGTRRLALMNLFLHNIGDNCLNQDLPD